MNNYAYGHVKPGSGAGTEARDDYSNWNTAVAVLTVESHALRLRMSVLLIAKLGLGRSPGRRRTSNKAALAQVNGSESLEI
jgi:hypothetical protein